jgi:putative ABC transport system substrate-binding protein
VEGLRQGLRELGYVEGQNIVIEYRYAEDQPERLPALVAELVRLQVDVICALGSPATRAAQQGTTSIPIVSTSPDPVGSGFVASLARPGGNITGLSMSVGAEGVAGKWLELLKEAVPKSSRVAVLMQDNPTQPAVFKAMQQVAPALGLTVHAFPVQHPDELDAAFAAMTRAGVEALVVIPGGLTVSHRTRVVELATRHRFPSIYEQRYFVTAGGLMSYGVSISDIWRRAASYVDRILKGTKPGDLPIEQPMRFELVLNRKTAQTLGVTFPPTLLVLADEVLE